MSVFVISDPHLSFSTDKPMDIFGERWTNHYERIKQNWVSAVGENDTVVIPGDVSWGMSLESAKSDLEFLHLLPGKKIIGRGNHDYWWATASKMNAFTEANGLSTLKFLYNNAYHAENLIICGTRCWMSEFGVKSEDERIIRREVERLRLSLTAGKKLKEEFPETEYAVFTHYPLAFGDFVNEGAISALTEFGAENVYYGHLHGVCESQLTKEIYGIKQSLTACDYLDFCPIKLC